MSSIHNLQVCRTLNEIAQCMSSMPSASVSQWTSRIRALQQPESQHTVGILGRSGHGKSSLINALLGETVLLPTNCRRACTAVVTKLCWNDKGSDPYRAEVEFLSAAEWREELEMLFRDLPSSDDKSINWSSRKEEPAAIALAKLMAVYPRISKTNVRGFRPGDLQDAFVEEVLGKVLEFQSQTPEGLQTKMKTYVDSKEKRSSETNRDTAYWPLIREVRVYSNASILETGCVLVDLPGIGDSNPARAAVAEKYIQKCDEIWILACISRAEDDSIVDTAMKLFSTRFKRQLYRDGSLSHLSFICTKSDVISVEAARSDFDEDSDVVEFMENVLSNRDDLTRRQRVLLAQVTEVECRIERMQKRMKPRSRKREHEDDRDPPSKKRKSCHIEHSGREHRSSLLTSATQYYRTLSSQALTTHQSTPSEESINELQAKKGRLYDAERRITDQMNELKQKEWLRLVQARNKLAQANIQDAFRDMLEDLDDDVGDSNLGSSFDTTALSAQSDGKAIPVHCVSSEGFQALENSGNRQTSFRNVEDTGIPALANHVHTIGRVKAEARSSAYLNEAKGLLTSLRLWLHGGDKDSKAAFGRLKAEPQGTDRLETLFENTKASLLLAISNIRRSISREITKRLPYAAASGSARAIGIIRRWQEPIHYQTYRAIMRRGGVWYNGKQYNLNAELASLFSEFIDPQWNQTFTTTVPSEIDQAVAQCDKLSRSFCNRFSQHTTPQGPTSIDQMTLKAQVHRFHNSTRVACEQIKANIQAEQRSLNRRPEEVIRVALEGTYRNNAAESGRGMLERMKERTTKDVDFKKEHIFHQVQSILANGIDTILTDQARILTNSHDRLAQSLRQDCLILLNQELHGPPGLSERMIEELTTILDGMEPIPEEHGARPKAVASITRANTVHDTTSGNRQSGSGLAHTIQSTIAKKHRAVKSDDDDSDFI